MCTRNTSSRPISIGRMSGFEMRVWEVLVEAVPAKEDEHIPGEVHNHVGDEKKTGCTNESLVPTEEEKTRKRFGDMKRLHKFYREDRR